MNLNTPRSTTEEIKGEIREESKMAPVVDFTKQIRFFVLVVVTSVIGLSAGKVIGRYFGTRDRLETLAEHFEKKWPT